MRGETRALTENDIGQTGYVADTLYAAFYSLIHADSFETIARCSRGSAI